MLWLLPTALAMPLTAVSYDVKVDGPLAEVVVEQTFVNDGPSPIEAVYAFPLHEEAAVDGMRMEIGPVIIQGEVRERARAEADYAAALERGHTAALTVQQRPNLFAQRVGNIPAGEEVTVRLRVIQPVPRHEGAYELVIPLAAGPRFLPAREFDRGGDPFTTPLVAPSSATVDVQIASAVPFVRFESSHPLDELAARGDTAWAQSAEMPLDRDFRLSWSVATDRPSASLYVDDGHALIAMDPPERAPRQQIVPREYVFVIDQSGSMTGEPMRLVKAAADRILDQTDHRDSLRIVSFANHVEADLRSVPLTDLHRQAARARLASLRPGGGTYLLDGVVEGLNTRDDPIRERTIVFMSDGLIGDERAVLARIADGLGKARLFVLGVGPVPNRWLLEEMARFGGGTATWIEPGEDPDLVVHDFVDRIAEPVLTDIEVDWADWEVEGAWPKRLPALYAGEPLFTGVRIRRRGTQPVVVRGWMGDGPFEAILTPTEAASERSVASTWARQRIGELERDQVWGDVPEIASEILTTALEYQVLSRYTAFIAVFEGEPVREVEAPERRRVIKTLQRRGGETVEVSAMRRTVDVESTSHSQVITKDFLQRIPAGRSYQTAVQLAPGVTGSNPNMAGGATNSSTYMLDGVNITDPVSGTFSVAVLSPAVSSVEITQIAPKSEVAGAAGSVTEIHTRSGTNNLEMEAEVGHMLRLADPLHATHGGMTVSGPVVRDRVWMLASYRVDQSAIASRTFTGHRGFAKLTAQPGSRHRLGLTTALDLADGEREGMPFGQRNGLSSLRWQWFPNPDTAVESTAAVQRVQLGEELRDRLAAHSEVALHMGAHDLKAGAGIESLRWELAAERAETWLGVPADARGSSTRVGLFAQDDLRFRELRVSAGARADVTLGRAHLAPRLALSWVPHDRLKASLAVGRRYGHLGLVSSVVDRDRGLSRVDEAVLLQEVEIVRDTLLWGSASARVHHDLPSFGGGREDLQALGLTFGLRKVYTRRWAFGAEWSTTHRLDDLAPTLLQDGSVEGFRHRLSGQFAWSLPTDPWTQEFGLSASVQAGPLGTLVPDPVTGALPNASRWSLSARFSQAIDLRKGKLWVDLEATHLSVLDDTLLDRWVTVQEAVPLSQGYEGTRLHGGLRYGF